MKTPSVKVLTGASFGCRSRKKPSRAAAHVEQAADILRVGLRLQAGGEHDHVHRDAADKAGQRVLDADDQLALLLRRHGPVGDLADAAADEMHALVEQLVVELLVAFAGGADVDVEVVDLRLGVLLEQVRQLHGVHAADARAPAVGLLVARADAVDDADGLRVLAVAQDDLAARWGRRR